MNVTLESVFSSVACLGASILPPISTNTFFTQKVKCGFYYLFIYFCYSFKFFFIIKINECGSGHFHSGLHFCDNTHKCAQKCARPGFCHVETSTSQQKFKVSFI